MTIRILEGDCRARLKEQPDKSVQLVVTSPPYFNLRDYGTGSWTGGDPACDHRGAPMATRANINRNAGVAGVDIKNAEMREPMGQSCKKCGASRVDRQIGLEESPQAFVAALVEVFREVWRVLRDDGLVFLNLGDSYANDGKWGGSTGGKHVEDLHGNSGIGRSKRKTGLKPKDLMGIPWRVAFALQDDGWWLRQDVIWHKENPMPESVDDRCTKAHEYIFMLSKAERYFFDAEAIAENRVGDEDAATFRGGSYVRNEDNTAGGGRTTTGNRKRGLTPRHSPYTSSSDQSGLDETGRGGRRNKRSVWTVAARPFSGEFCRACQTYFEGPRLEALRVEKIQTGEGTEQRIRHCSCGRTDSWVAHFATFPPDLIKPCILAGTSEKGACATCHAPLRRDTEKVRRYASNAALAGATHESLNGSGKWRDGKGGKNLKMGPVVDTVTIGWRPTCDCRTTKTVPCVVLDPFGGAGTTMMVADRLGRDGISIDLNPDYAEMSRQRVRSDAPLFSEVS